MAHSELTELIQNAGRLDPAHALAWEQWTGFLPPESRQELFELQVILSGMAALAQIENHGPDKLRTDFRPHLIALQKASHAALSRTRSLRKRAASQQRLRAVGNDQVYSPVPEDALGILERTLSDALRVLDPFCRSLAVDLDAFRSCCDLITRDLERNPFLAPLGSLEFTSFPLTFIENEQLGALSQCTSESARAVAIISTLCLLRMARIVRLAQELHDDASTRPATHVLWAVLRRDSRHLSKFLSEQGARTLAGGLSAQILSVPDNRVQNYERFASERIDELRKLQVNIEACACTLEQQVEDTLFHVPSIDSSMLTQARIFEMLGAAVQEASSGLSQMVESIQHAWQAEVTAADAQRIRVHVWMVQHVLRAFIAKASAVTFVSTRLDAQVDLGFATDFINHFRALGRPVVEEVAYDRKRELVIALKRLRESESLDVHMLNEVAAECSLYWRHLDRVLSIMCARTDVPSFDKAAAARRFRRYLASIANQGPVQRAEEPKTHQVTQ